MRITDIFLAFPRLVLALAFAAALGPGIENAVIAIALTAWPPYARLARAETLTRRRAEFIQAAELQGASHLRVIATQILPLCLPSVIIRLTLDMAGIILTAAGLGFAAPRAGLGSPAPIALTQAAQRRAKRRDLVPAGRASWAVRRAFIGGHRDPTYHRGLAEG